MKPARGWFYPGMAIAVGATVFAGFAATYYLRPSGAPPLSMLVHVHALVFTAWVLMLSAQTSLVAAGRRDLHKRLGVAGGTLAVAMVVLGVAVALSQARREVAAGAGDEALAFLIIPLGGMVSFAVLVALGITYRAHTEIHRRFMLLASIAILPAAIGRIPGFDSPATITLYFFAMLAVAPIHDLLNLRRLHPVSLWGGVAVFCYEIGRFLVSRTAAWRAVAEMLV